MDERTFGTFVTGKRLVRGMTLRGLAAKLNISPVYLCNMEKDRRAAPSEDVLERMAELLMLNRDERVQMFDLAAKSKNSPSVAIDLPDYINERSVVRNALRAAKEMNASDEEWLEFIKRLQKRTDE